MELVSTDAFESLLVSHRAGGTRYGHNQPPFLVHNRHKLQSTAVLVGLSVVRSCAASILPSLIAGTVPENRLMDTVRRCLSH